MQEFFNNLTLLDVFIRFFGVVGLALCVLSFQFKKHKGIMIVKTCSELCFAVQYILLGAWTGALLDGVSILRNSLFAWNVEKKRSTLPVIIAFGMLVIVLGISSWAGPISILPVAAKLISTVSYGMKKERILRLIALPSCILWVIYNLTIGGFEAAISDTLTFASILVAIYKFDIKKPR